MLGLSRLRFGLRVLVLGVMGVLLLAASLGCFKHPILKIDGSSTVFPITEAMAEEFQKKFGEFRVTVGVSGTGGGFKKFCGEEIDITGASRPIKPIEVEACGRNNVEYLELPVAFDGLAVVVNSDNDWVDFVTLDDLKRIWEPGSTVKKWSDVRPLWPQKDIKLAGADTDSGTFDYFTKAIVGEEGASRPDYTASTDDNVLVQAVALEKYAFGYLGFAYYAENVDRLKLVPVDAGNGPVAPSRDAINTNAYFPLSRPLFIYVRSKAAQRPEVREFVNFFLSPENGEYLRETGYVEFPERLYAIVQDRFRRGVTGSMFGGKGSQTGISLEDLLEEES